MTEPWPKAGVVAKANRATRTGRRIGNSAGSDAKIPVLDNPNIAAMLILLSALLAGFVLVWRLTSLLSNKGDPGLPIGIFVAAIAAPFVGSAIAFVLQMMGIVFFTLAGAVVGFLIWIATQLTVFFAVFKAGRAVQENAALLKNIDDRLR